MNRRHDYLPIECILIFLAAGWAALGMYYGLSGSTATPTGNVFLAAATYMGSWQVLEGFLVGIVVIGLVGIIANLRILQLLSTGIAVFIWSFVAFGLATRPGGFFTTATAGYISFAAMSMVVFKSLFTQRQQDSELITLRVLIGQQREELKQQRALLYDD